MIPFPQSWTELPWGEFYRDSLDSHLEPWWPKLFGFHLLKVGSLSIELDTTKCSISHQVGVAQTGTANHQMQVVALPYMLPFESKSVDACLLAHTLCYSDIPQHVLREADRVLIDDGWLILSVFNSVSLLGIGRCLPMLRKRHPYCAHTFTQFRLMDWLYLLNYEVVHQSRFQVFPWTKRANIISRHFPAVGCMSLLIARKRTLPLTPTPTFLQKQQPVWRRAVGAATPFSRDSR